MDSGLNRNAGYFIKNFYQAQLRPAASEREQLVAGKITTIVFGVSSSSSACGSKRWKNASSSTLMQRSAIGSACRSRCR
jgi:hypothetical protein